MNRKRIISSQVYYITCAKCETTEHRAMGTKCGHCGSIQEKSVSTIETVKAVETVSVPREDLRIVLAVLSECPIALVSVAMLRFREAESNLNNILEYTNK